MKNLTPVNQTLADFRSELMVGMVLVFADGTKQLVGHINDYANMWSDDAPDKEHNAKVVIGYYTIDYDVPAAVLEPLKVTDVVRGARIWDNETDSVFAVSYVEQRRVFYISEGVSYSLSLDAVTSGERYFKEPK